MRVVAGELRGRPLLGPKGLGTRPTSSKVRTAIFNALESLGAVDGARVLDLFAGSGAMGIEALSRGADHVTFVERDRDALAALRANLDALGLGRERAAVVVGDALGLVAAGRLGGPFDLAVLDPPYAFEGWDGLLGSLAADVSVCESGREVEPPAGWRLVRVKPYGSTVVTICRRHDQEM
jgi:16S rRNA (guanine966-N2)-methyltransferase